MAISFRRFRRPFSLLTTSLLVLSGFAALPSPSRAQEVYFGVADQWDDLLKNPEQWKFVRENADGFYVNFIEMDWLKNNPKRMNPEKLKQTAQLYTHKNALIESDMHASMEDDQRYIRDLQTAGFFLPYTSLNYGWSAERANNLKTFQLLSGQTPRVNLVQLGPWTIGGDIKGDSGSTEVAKNTQYRDWIKDSDGVSTDGPLGLWQMDAGKMRTGSFSVVTYAASLKKKSLVMLCPYGAGNKLYTPAQALSMSQQCVREHEDAGAIPTIWSVFEYATDIAAVPEAVAGKPISTTSGIAFWLIHHIQDPQRVARLSIPKQPGITTKTALLIPIGEAETIVTEGAELTEATVTAPTPTAGKPWTITCELNNDSSWLDLCPVLTTETNDPNNAWDISYNLGGVDVTQAMQKGEGVVCVGDLRLWHQSKQALVITLKPRKPNAKTSPLGLYLKLKPHPTQFKRLQQQIVLRID